MVVGVSDVISVKKNGFSMWHVRLEVEEVVLMPGQGGTGEHVLIHLMIFHSKKCHRPRTPQAVTKNSEVEHSTSYQCTYQIKVLSRVNDFRPWIIR